MKYIYVFILAVIAYILGGTLAMASCDKHTYDQIYKAIIQQCIHDDNYRARNGAIIMLRKLCDGQTSSYEKGDDI